MGNAHMLPPVLPSNPIIHERVPRLLWDVIMILEGRPCSWVALR